MTESQQSSFRILLVEDDPTNQYVFRAILSSRGYNVAIAEDGLLGLEAAFAERPDIILLDMMMPNMDGYEAAGILCADERTNTVPIVALTAKAMVGDREKCLAAGCDDYLAKPVGRQALLDLVERWLQDPPVGWLEKRRERSRRSA